MKRPIRKSTYSWLGLPDGFGVVILTLGLILALAPYLPGFDFGMFKVPIFSTKLQAAMKVVGPIIFFLIIALFIPWRLDPPDTPSLEAQGLGEPEENRNIERVYGQRAGDIPAKRSQITSPLVAQFSPNKLHPRQLLRKTPHSTIERVSVSGEQCVLKCTDKRFG